MGDHVVRFVDGDHDLADAVAMHVAEGLDRGEAGVVIATPEHCHMFRAGLTGTERMRFLDAAETLAACMVDGWPDARRFDAVIGGAVREAAAGATGVRAFGEMVVLLWEAGNVAAAIEMEHLWNVLCATEPVSLLCAYPWRVIAQDGTLDDFAAVCHAHDEVVGAAPSAPDADVVRRLPKTADAARQARRFVTDVLETWGAVHLVDDAALVVTELTTNALRHAHSDVTVSLQLGAHVVRLGVGDASPLPPQPRDALPADIGGRGLRLVRAAATEWGHRRLGAGKVVWADLPLL